jgi:hypothetical protein
MEAYQGIASAMPQSAQSIARLQALGLPPKVHDLRSLECPAELQDNQPKGRICPQEK